MMVTANNVSRALSQVCSARMAHPADPCKLLLHGGGMLRTLISDDSPRTIDAESVRTGSKVGLK